MLSDGTTLFMCSSISRDRNTRTAVSGHSRGCCDKIRLSSDSRSNQAEVLAGLYAQFWQVEGRMTKNCFPFMRKHILRSSRVPRRFRVHGRHVGTSGRAGYNQRSPLEYTFFRPFPRLVFGCINADFCVQGRIFQRFSSSTFFPLHHSRFL